jgi:hypothetical protein
LSEKNRLKIHLQLDDERPPMEILGVFEGEGREKGEGTKLVGTIV